MELKDLLKYENVEIIDSVKDWRDAVEVATRKLVEQGYIEPRYTEAIIESAIEHNAYFVLCPGVALLHASSDKGVNETQLSITYVKEPFRFEGKDEDVNLMITSFLGSFLLHCHPQGLSLSLFLLRHCTML